MSEQTVDTLSYVKPNSIDLNRDLLKKKHVPKIE